LVGSRLFSLSLQKEPSWVWWWLVVGAFFTIFVFVVLIAGCESEARSPYDANDDAGVSAAFWVLLVFATLIVIGAIVAFGYFAVKGNPLPPDPWTNTDTMRRASVAAIILIVVVPVVLLLLCLCVVAEPGARQRQFQWSGGRWRQRKPAAGSKRQENDSDGQENEHTSLLFSKATQTSDGSVINRHASKRSGTTQTGNLPSGTTTSDAATESSAATKSPDPAVPQILLPAPSPSVTVADSQAPQSQNSSLDGQPEAASGARGSE
jgi:hypothetical protein